MKWENYSKLSPELQAEYNWKFHNKQYHVNISLLYLLITWAFITLCVFGAYAIAVSPNHLNMPFNRINDLITRAVAFTQAVVLIFVVEVLYYLGYIIYKFVEEDKWKKKNGLKW